MNRPLHRALLVGCAGLTVLYARPAWNSLSTALPRNVDSLAGVPSVVPRGAGELLSPGTRSASAPLEAEGTSSAEDLVAAGRL